MDNVFLTIVMFIVVGAIIGFIARAVLPGRDAMSVPMTILLGVAGAVIGGLVGRAINGDDGGSVQWILSVIAAVVLLLVFRSVGGRGRRSVL